MKTERIKNISGNQSEQNALTPAGSKCICLEEQTNIILVSISMPRIDNFRKSIYNYNLFITDSHENWIEFQVRV